MHRRLVGCDIRRLDEASTFAVCRALEWNMNPVRQHQPHTPVYSAIHVEVAGGHRRHVAEIIVAAVGDLHSNHVLFAKAYPSRYIQRETRVSTFVLSGEMPIDINERNL